MSRKPPAVHNPLFRGEITLEFDNVDAQLLSEDEKTDRFMSIYLRVAHPLTLNKAYFSSGDPSRNSARVFHMFKAGYKNFVVKLNWTEKKYAAVITDILETGKPATFNVMEEKGKAFDNNSLLSQRRLARKGGKRI